METTRVRKLIYRQTWLDPHGHRVTPNAPSLPTFRVGDFDASLESGHWTFVPIADFYSEESARAALEPRLRDWEIEWDLADQLRVSFEFDSCIFEEPERVGSDPINFPAKLTVRTSISASFTVARGNYPNPPSFTLHDSPLARQLVARWHDIEDGRDKLLSGAYWFVTTFEGEFGGGARKIAAKNLRVEFDVLDALGRLSSQNDPAESRKNEGPIRPLTNDEKAWIRAVIPKLAKRAIEVRSGRCQLPEITLKDLPRVTR